MERNQNQRAAPEHLLLHFTRASAWRSGELPVITRGEGCYVYDDRGRRFLDGLSGLFCVNIGHGRSDIVVAAAKQMETLAYATNWGAAHPSALEAAELIAGLAPGDLDHVFFVSSGSEAIEAAIKFARQAQLSRGYADRTKLIAREMAYHGTTLGALSLTGIPKYRAPFGPLLDGVFHVPNTLGAELAPGAAARDMRCLQAIEEVIEREGAETIAAIFAEPVQNGRGALVPPLGYWRELRAICDRFGILLVADEVVNAFGRLGSWFGVEREGVVPDILAFAKGSTSGYAPLGGFIARRTLVEQLFDSPEATFWHGATWGGHPVATATAIANITALRNEDVPGNVARNSSYFRNGLEGLLASHRILKEVRGAGYFYALELAQDRESSAELTSEQSATLVRETLPALMREVGLLTRPDDRGGTMIMLAPPLIADRAVLDELLCQLDSVLTGAARSIDR